MLIRTLFILSLLIIRGGTQDDYEKDDYKSGEEEEEGEISAKCEFFTEWNGDWFFPKERDTLPITNTSFGTIGICMQVFDEQNYLLYNREMSCYKCVQIFDRHPNVLQYKEGSCREELFEDGVCADISEDMSLQTAVKMSGEDVDCPFQDAFTFTYTEDGVDCELPLSKLDQCMVPSQVLFKFTPCTSSLGAQSEENLLFYQVVNQKRGSPAHILTCKGLWHADVGSSTSFLIGTLTGPYTATPLFERIRCFAYHPHKGDRRNGRSFLGSNEEETISDDSEDISGYKVIQSRDASCSDLLSRRTGALRSMFLTPAPKIPPLIKNPEEDECIFPYWASSLGSVFNLPYTYKYEFSEDGTRLWSSNYSHHTQTAHLLSVTECYSVVEEDKDSLKMIAKVTAECMTSFKCLKLYRRSDHIVEIQEGVSSKFETDACSLLNFVDDKMSFTTLIREEAPVSSCVADGYHNVTELSWGRMTNPCGRVHGFKEVNVKCKGPEVIEFIQECEGIFKDSVFHCLGGWESTISYKDLPQIQIKTENPYSVYDSAPSYMSYEYSLVDGEDYDYLPENVTYGFMIARPSTSESTSVQPLRVCFIYFHYNYTYSWTVDVAACLRNIRPGVEGKYRFNSTKLEACTGVSYVLTKKNSYLLWLSIVFFKIYESVFSSL